MFPQLRAKTRMDFGLVAILAQDLKAVPMDLSSGTVASGAVIVCSWVWNNWVSHRSVVHCDCTADFSVLCLLERQLERCGRDQLQVPVSWVDRAGLFVAVSLPCFLLGLSVGLSLRRCRQAEDQQLPEADDSHTLRLPLEDARYHPPARQNLRRV